MIVTIDDIAPPIEAIALELAATLPVEEIAPTATGPQTGIVSIAPTAPI